MVQRTTKDIQVIRDQFKTAQSRQKSYADKRRRDLEFQVSDHVFLKVTPTRCIQRFGVKGKLSPRFIGPFEVLERIGEVAYRLALPPDLACVHNVFHVSMLRKYVYDPTHIIRHEKLVLNKDVTYEEKLIKILERKVQQLRNRPIHVVKVLWNNCGVEQATWEPERVIRRNYPDHFGKTFLPYDHMNLGTKFF